MTSARNFLSAEEQQMLLKAIADVEKRTSGEVRVHIENNCNGDELAAAQAVFSRLGMHKTKERNGVLFFIAVVSHKVAVIGDAGIHEKVGQEYWQHLIDKIIEKFRNDKRGEVLAECIRECGDELAKHFPRRHDDNDELSNDISYA